VLATISAPRPPRKVSTTAAAEAEAEYLSESVQYVAGIGLLSLALFLSAWLGLWQESTYRQYGNQWREALFYNVSFEGFDELTSALPLASLLPPYVLVAVKNV
jgi:UDP-xylose/UDP-N-acetylglucosamine transporter B4